MTGELVLITGATGYLGFRALRYALEQGYKVRAAVRSEAKAESIRSNPALVELKSNPELSFAVVPDIRAPDAYFEAIKDVSYVIHIASPPATTAGDDFEATLIQPAVQGTLGMLEAAKKSGTVKRVVITSSCMSIIDWEPLTGGPFDRVLKSEDRIATPSGPYAFALHAYWASKVTALNRAEEWIKEHTPDFDVIHIHPSYIEGRNDTAQTVHDLTTGTNGLLLGPALGETSRPNCCTTNSVHDTAWVHVEALKPGIPGNQSYIVSSPGDDREWNDVKDIVAKAFPDAVEGRVLPNNGDSPTFVLRCDGQKAQDTLGFQLRGLDEQVVDVVQQYLEIVGAA